MIRIGLAGWGDHDLIYPPGIGAQDKLKMYSQYFTTVEVDSSFYAIQKEEWYRRWADDTPAGFSFLVKAYQGMTGHTRDKYEESETEAMFERFKQSIGPTIEAGKLKAVLFQYPPWFDCTRDHVNELRKTKARMDGIPVALEFRHQSWFEPAMREKTLAFMRKEGWIHSICDEPDVYPGSVPTVLEPTDDRLTVIRFHGRNAPGWTASRDGNWREVRYLYRYSREELLEWSANMKVLREKTDELCVIFNNNSGGDAAFNARQLNELLGIANKPLPPQQLDLF